MKKIPTLYVRDPVTHLVIPDVTPGCEWVLEGKGYATRKYDGTCCMVQDNRLFKRHEVRHALTPDGISLRCLPPKFIEADRDPVTGTVFGWLPVGYGPEDQWHREAWEKKLTAAGTLSFLPVPDGTYELCGPKVQGNPEGRSEHVLLKHPGPTYPFLPRTFTELQKALSTMDVEGVVWWEDPSDPGCRKAKIKKKDFGLPRKP